MSPVILSNTHQFVDVGFVGRKNAIIFILKVCGCVEFSIQVSPFLFNDSVTKTLKTDFLFLIRYISN